MRFLNEDDYNKGNNNIKIIKGFFSLLSQLDECQRVDEEIFKSE
jgi:hypothetical protein